MRRGSDRFLLIILSAAGPRWSGQAEPIRQIRRMYEVMHLRLTNSTRDGELERCIT